MDPETEEISLKRTEAATLSSDGPECSLYAWYRGQSRNPYGPAESILLAGMCPGSDTGRQYAIEGRGNHLPTSGLHFTPPSKQHQ